MRCVGVWVVCTWAWEKETDRQSKYLPGPIGYEVMYLVTYFGFILNIMEPFGEFWVEQCCDLTAVL